MAKKGKKATKSYRQTRLEASKRVAKKWTRVEELVTKAVRRLENTLPKTKIGGRRITAADVMRELARVRARIDRSIHTVRRVMKSQDLERKLRRQRPPKLKSEELDHEGHRVLLSQSRLQGW